MSYRKKLSTASSNNFLGSENVSMMNQLANMDSSYYKHPGIAKTTNDIVSKQIILANPNNHSDVSSYSKISSIVENVQQISSKNSENQDPGISASALYQLGQLARLSTAYIIAQKIGISASDVLQKTSGENLPNDTFQEQEPTFNLKDY